MSNNNTAKEFLDLWQKQLSAALTDPATINSYNKLMVDFSRIFTTQSEGVKTHTNEESNQQPTQPTASAHEFINSIFGQLAVRITDVEQRLAAIEQSCKPAAPAKRRKTSAVRKSSS